ncbi:MAG TPA: hypothetical protein VFR47_07475 [Anaerolineales bacterium]|nr:hypothetical protein [Anaerolineales bacterium]
MHKPYTFLSIPILMSFLASCAGNVAAEANEIPPTNTPEKVQSTATPEVVPQDPPATCLITVPQDPPFTPPAPYDALGFEGDFWYGSNSLWTAVPQSGTWRGLPLNSGGYTQKVFWWRDGYVWNEEPEPNLIVTGERLDAKAPPLKASKATNAYASDIGSAMLVGVDIPTAGCWKITGRYNDEAELSFVVWVAQ